MRKPSAPVLLAGISFQADAYGVLRGEAANGVQLWIGKRGRRFHYGTGERETCRERGSAADLQAAADALLAAVAGPF